MNELSSLLDRYKSIVVFDTETTGLNFCTDQIIELAAVKIQKNERGKVELTDEMDEFIRLPEGKLLDPFVINLTGITDEMLLTKGILRGGGDTRFLLWADIIFMYILSLPLGALTGIKLGWAPFWVFTFLRIDNVAKSFLCLWRFFSYKWIKKVK